MDEKDRIGRRGENIAAAKLMKPTSGPLALFDVFSLGDKYPTYDLLVHLVGDIPSAPFFFAQVKSTRTQIETHADRLSVKLSKGDVTKMRASPIPTYLIGVDDFTEEAYIVSIHGSFKASISSIRTTYPLNAQNLKILYDEVKLHWESLAPLSRRKVSTFQI